MIHKRSRAHAATCLISDVAAVVAAFFTAWWLRFETDLLLQWVGEKPTPHFDYYLRLLPFLALTWPAVFYFRGLYEPRRGRSRYRARPRQAGDSRTSGTAAPSRARPGPGRRERVPP